MHQQKIKQYKSTIGMSREQWLAERLNGIGGSEVASAMGLNPYQSPYTFWEIKTGRKEAPDLSGNSAVVFGNLLEDKAARLFEMETGYRTRKDNKIRYHKQHPELFASLDRTVLTADGTGLLEIKTTTSYTLNQWENEVPPHYYAQVQHYFAITGYRFGFFALLILDQRKLKIIPVQPDPAYIQFQTDFLVSWCAKHLRDDIPPERQVSDWAETPSLPATKEADESLYSVWLDLSRLQQMIATASARKKSLEDIIKQAMGEYDTMTYGTDILCTWKTRSSERLDTKALREAHPDIAARFLARSSSRVFQIKEL